MKRIITFVMTIAVLFSLLTVTAFADSTYNVGVFDFAEVLTDEEEDALMNLGKMHSRKCDLDIVFLTASDNEGKSPTYYCDDFHDYLVGSKGYNRDQIILYLDLDDGCDHLGCYEKAIDIISADEAERVLDEAYMVSESDYFGRLQTLCIESSEMAQLSNMADFELFGFFPVGFSTALIGVFISIGVGFVLWKKHTNANNKTCATLYLKKNDINVTNKDTRFIRTYETVQAGYYKKKSSSGGTHRTSGGSRSRGSSRKR